MANRVTENDSIRERELFRYFQPLAEEDDVKPTERQSLDGTVDDALITKAIESPDATLTALAQLCACRLDASRAMISVIGKEKQHFIAEATRTLQLSDTRNSEDVNDGLWAGCTTVDKHGRLCEKTIELTTTSDKYPCFTVTDLSADDRFKELPFVSGPPSFRFYAGTPLRTKRGINIGSLFVIDDRVRPALTASQVDLLGTVAGIIMRNMELNHEAEERKRSLQMSGALNAFQEGRVTIDEANTLGSSSSQISRTPTSRRAKLDSMALDSNGSHEELDGMIDSHHTSSPGRSPNADKSTSPAYDPELPGPSQSSGTQPSVQDQNPKSIFARAASLLRQALDLQETGGVVFLDASVGIHRQETDISDSSSVEGKQFSSSYDTKSPVNGSFRNRTYSKNYGQASEVIGFSTSEYLVGSQANMGNVNSFSPVDQSTLQGLLQCYPRGKLWCFDEDGMLPAWDEDLFDGHSDVTPGETAVIRHQRQQTEAIFLSKYFPKVRQLLFAPLWDSRNARWFSGCFCFSTSPHQIFSMEVELTFLSTFCNTVMAEASRVAYVAAERQKGDFIGSISHELRSPLHGILASAELLADTESDPFQNSLVDTISSCGRTLLDTVNHILDYSKINTYERNWQTARKSRAQKSTFAIKSKAAVLRSDDKEAPPLMNIYATTNVAAVAEEVIEGVYAGQTYQDISSTDIAFMSSETKSKISERGTASERRTIGDTGKRIFEKDVEVILDISRGDFVFTTQPGALRRIIMNLFGNSLKYTEKGVIVVSLALSDVNDGEGANSDDKILEINIRDTGKGISSEYLMSNLFTPFSQEDTLATGVGLGLSIVKSIINMLNGSIDFRSQVGKGTEVSVRIPLMRLPGTATTESTPSTVASSGGMSTCMQGLQSDHAGKSAVLYGFHSERESSSRDKERARVLHTYVTQWFGLQAASRYEAVDLVIVDEKDLAELQSTKLCKFPTVVLCGASPPRMGNQSRRASIMEFVSRPFGPYKLAKAVLTCLEKANGNIDGELDPAITFPEESPISSEADTIIPGFGGLNICSRVSSVSSRSPLSEYQTKSNRQDFPFPEAQHEKNEDQKPGLTRQDSRRPKLTQRATEPAVRTRSTAREPTPIASPITKTGEAATSSFATANSPIAVSTVETQPDVKTEPADPKGLSVVSPGNSKRPPRLLLVDDNKINLRLLETFMKKRKYKSVDSAEDGQLAVDAAHAHNDGYDIIFMDISMPIMNGFEATRAIRAIEDERNAAPEGTLSERKENHALIIALTGLASSRDQTEAFNSGVDLFMTKPVSFKEVGRLLDNWEARAGDGGGDS